MESYIYYPEAVSMKQLTKGSVIHARTYIVFGTSKPLRNPQDQMYVLSTLCTTGQPPYSLLDTAATILALPNREIIEYSNKIRKLKKNLPRQCVEIITRTPQ